MPAKVQAAIWNYKKDIIDPQIAEFYKNLGKEEWKIMVEKGVKPVRFAYAEDEKKYQSLAYDASWKDILEKSPELGPKLKSMLVK